MKIYIFVTFPITWVGGSQCYVASKSMYLEKEGWKVVVMSPGFSKKDQVCPISYLHRFLRYNFFELYWLPSLFPSFWVNHVINNEIGKIKDLIVADEIIIESHNDNGALWGELIAQTIGGRHVFFALSEEYRRNNQHYKDYMDFFIFKYNRGEILASVESLNRLFDGYKSFNDAEIEGPWLLEDPVQDVENDRIDSIINYDYNICYIGRTNKSYVLNIINGIKEFADNNIKKTIQFIIVGDSSLVSEKLLELKKSCKNLIITELGELHPIPRKLFGKVDVVIGGSGCARCSVKEGALTIVADTESGMAMGLLGYDTNESVFKSEDCVVTNFYEALNRALIERVHLHLTYKYPQEPSVEECTKQNFRLIYNATKEIDYYNKNMILEGKHNFMFFLKVLFRKSIVL